MAKFPRSKRVHKGQQDIISAVIIIVIAIALVATAYTWGIPLIQKRQDSAVVDRTFSYFDQNNINSITSKIVAVATNGGDQTFTGNVKGGWILSPCVDTDGSGSPLAGCVSTYTPENNSLSFAIYSTVSNYAYDVGWITISSSDKCPPSAGITGQNPYVVCVRADRYSSGYNITYKVQFRELDSDATQGFKILLQPQISSIVLSSGNTVRFTRGNVYSVDVGGKTLNIVEVKVLLG